MKDSSIYFIEMLIRMKLIKSSDEFQAEINATPACLNLFTTASGYCDSALDWQQKLKKSSKAYTISGMDIKDVVAKNYSITALVMSSLGEKMGIDDLKNLKGKYTYSALCHKPAEDLVVDCNYILELIDEHDTALADYKINAAYVTNLTNLKVKLDDLSKLPTEVIKKHKNDLIQYDELEKKAKSFFTKEMDPFMAIYEIADIEFFLAYKAARMVRHHHMKRKPKEEDQELTTGILELLVLGKDSMEALPGVSFVAQQVNISITTDIDGETYNDELTPGTYHGKLSLEGYKTIEFDFTIEAGKTCALQFLMEVVPTT